MASKAEEMNEENTEAQNRNWGKILLLAGLFLLLLWLGLKSWRMGSATYSLWQIKNEAQMMLAGGITTIDPDDAEQMVLAARSNVLTIKDETEFLMPITPHLGWVPTVGPLLINAEHFMEMADAGTETAVYAVRGLKPALTILQVEESGESRIPQLVGVIKNARPDLAQAEISLQRVAQAYAQLENIEQFPQQLQPIFALADEMLPLAQDGLKIAQVLPQIAGADAPKTYLILAQNDDELRATGGFITGVGVLTVDNGRIMQLDFQDAVLVDNINNGLYDYPPQPLQQFMGLDYFVFRDANFWPDFPTSAENAIKLYALGQNLDPTTFDGVIAIDQPFLELLVTATGPIKISGTELTLTGENIIDSLRDTWVSRAEGGENEQDWLSSRKNFLSVFAGEIRNRLENDIASVNPLLFSRNMYQAIQTKRLQLYFRDPDVLAVLEEINWDGRLENLPNQDFLMILDTNMGYNKANINIQQDINYQIDLDNNIANLDINYTHTQDPQDKECAQDFSEEFIVATSYLQIANQCYFDYLRIYTPLNSHILDSSQHNVPNDLLIPNPNWNHKAQTIQEINGLNTFYNFFILPWGQSEQVHLEYKLPNNIVQTNNNGNRVYKLLLFKQAGIASQPVTLTINLPKDSQIVQTTHLYANSNTDQITFTLNSEQDTLVELEYKSTN